MSIDFDSLVSFSRIKTTPRQYDLLHNTFLNMLLNTLIEINHKMKILTVALCVYAPIQLSGHFPKTVKLLVANSIPYPAFLDNNMLLSSVQYI